MKLNIHLISHPLIQSLSNTASNLSLPTNIINQAIKHLGLFIIYETIRKWIKAYKLIIQTTQSKKYINIIDPKESYTIIFNNIDHLNMLQEIQLLLPKVKLELIKNQETYNKDDTFPTLNNNHLHHKIIIINFYMDEQYIKNLIHHLVTKQKTRINQIYITCIKCTTNQLIQLSKTYQDLTIYTTQIIKT